MKSSTRTIFMSVSLLAAMASLAMAQVTSGGFQVVFFIGFWLLLGATFHFAILIDLLKTNEEDEDFSNGHHPTGQS